MPSYFFYKLFTIRKQSLEQSATQNTLLKMVLHLSTLKLYAVNQGRYLGKS